VFQPFPFFGVRTVLKHLLVAPSALESTQRLCVLREIMREELESDEAAQFNTSVYVFISSILLLRLLAGF
jgi:hypothetical protein